MIDYATTLEVFKKIAMAHKADEPHKRINSFAVINSFGDIEAVNANQGISGEAKGYYWSRYGISPNDDSKIYNTLFLNKRHLQVSGNDHCQHYLVGVAVPEYCEGCDSFDSNDASHLAQQLTYDVLRILSEFQLFDITHKDTREKEKVVAHESELVNCYNVVKSTCGYIAPDVSDTRISVFDYGAMRLQIGEAEIKICHCDNAPIEEKFDFCHQDKESEVGIVKCSSCT